MLYRRHIYRLAFSTISWSSSPNLVLSSIRAQIKSNKNFVKQNALHITHHLADMVDKREYQQLKKFVYAINLNSIDRWVFWQSLSKDITTSLQATKSMRQADLENLLEAFLKLRYEPNQKQNPAFTQTIKNILEATNINSILKISSLALQSSPKLFQPYRTQLQNSIMQHIKQHSRIKDIHKHFTLIQGIISNFWQPEFLVELSQLMPPASSEPQPNKEDQLVRSNHAKAMKFLQASNTTTPVTVTKLNSFNSDKAMSNTEHRIGLMLADLTYIFDENVSINGVEVDFLFPSVSTIVEFNGLTHYRINSNAIQQVTGEGKSRNKFINIKPTAYEKWRRRMFKARGFNFVELPFYEWEHIDGERDQKLYLISKIEHSILQLYRNKGGDLTKQPAHF